jgi:hypothetical protein
MEALEQLETLQTAAPVYKLTGGQERQYLADADRPVEVARLKTIVAGSCSAEPEIRRREESEAEHLHRARSPGCMEDRDRLSMMEKPEARTPEDDLARLRKQVAARCADVDLSNARLVRWVPVARWVQPVCGNYRAHREGECRSGNRGISMGVDIYIESYMGFPG